MYTFYYCYSAQDFFKEKWVSSSAKKTPGKWLSMLRVMHLSCLLESKLSVFTVNMVNLVRQHAIFSNITRC